MFSSMSKEERKEIVVSMGKLFLSLPIRDKIDALAGFITLTQRELKSGTLVYDWLETAKGNCRGAVLIFNENKDTKKEVS